MPASEIIKDIGMGLYKAACCVKLDGEVFDMRTVVDHDCHFEVMTFDSKAGKETFWHTASHLMAQAVKSLYPEAKLLHENDLHLLLKLFLLPWHNYHLLAYTLLYLKIEAVVLLIKMWSLFHL